MKRAVLLFIILFSLHFGFSQTNQVIINSDINLPKNDAESELLISCLNSLLNSVEMLNEENSYIFPSERIETFILLDELYEIRKSKIFDDSNFYKPYLLDIIPINKKKHLLKLSYIGVYKNIPYTRVTFDLIAYKVNDAFLFASSLIYNTRNWKTLKINNVTFHFKDTINEVNARAYEKYASQFDKKLNIKDKSTTLYCTNNLTDLLNLVGIHYKSDYNGRTEGVLSFVFNNEKLMILGYNSDTFDDFDPHDVWHNRLSLAVSRKLVNKPIDEACAYLYAGSWGMTWEDILKKFGKDVLTRKDNDWLHYKENQTNFGDSDAEHLMIDYVIDALIIKKLEEEKGFSAVWEFLNCGSYEKGNANYYKALEKLTGITKKNYNKEVRELLKKEQLLNL